MNARLISLAATLIHPPTPLSPPPEKTYRLWQDVLCSRWRWTLAFTPFHSLPTALVLA